MPITRPPGAGIYIDARFSAGFLRNTRRFVRILIHPLHSDKAGFEVRGHAHGPVERLSDAQGKTDGQTSKTGKFLIASLR